MQITSQQALICSEYVETHQQQARYVPRFPLRYGGHSVMRLVFNPRDLYAGRHCGYVVTTNNRVMRFSPSSVFTKRVRD